MKVLRKLCGSIEAFASVAESWVYSYFEQVGFRHKYSFVFKLAESERDGKESDVRKAYENLLEKHGNDFKAFTEIVMCVNLMAWFHAQLEREGVPEAEKWGVFYSDLYDDANERFYQRFEGNEEACDYYFECTD